jgi:hypothetical protein
MGYKDLVGEVSGISDSALTLETIDSTKIILIDSIKGMDVSTGRRSNVRKGALVGVLTGSALGAVLGWVTYTPCPESNSGGGGFGLIGDVDGCIEVSRSENIQAGILVGFLAGTLIGTLIGSQKRDQWEKIPNEILLNLEPVGALQPSRHPQLTLRWTIGSKK